MFPSPWVTALLPSAKEAIEFHLNPRESRLVLGPSLQDPALLPPPLLWAPVLSSPGQHFFKEQQDFFG